MNHLRIVLKSAVKARYFINFDYKMSKRICQAYVCVEYFMCELISDVINFCI